MRNCAKSTGAVLRCFLSDATLASINTSHLHVGAMVLMAGGYTAEYPWCSLCGTFPNTNLGQKFLVVIVIVPAEIAGGKLSWIEKSEAYSKKEETDNTGYGPPCGTVRGTSKLCGTHKTWIDHSVPAHGSKKTAQLPRI